MSNSFASFKQSFKGDIVTPTDADYAQAISRWAVSAQANAEIVAFVKTPEDVALAIAYARENRLPIAIRGGGHSTGGSSSTEGLVIDLSRHLNAVEIDPKNKLAYAGGGAIWEQVDKAAIAHGLASVAGTVNHVSHAVPLRFPFNLSCLTSSDWSRRVWFLNSHLLRSSLYFSSRLSLGGGVGHLSAEHGFVIDNIIKVIFFGRIMSYLLEIPTRLQLSPPMDLF